MSRSVLFVAIGGMIGSVSRFCVVSAVVYLFPSSFPYGTFLVNLIGSFAIGAAVGVAQRYDWLHHDWRIFLTAGFCGGFTTFSAFALENVEMLLEKSYLTFGLYSALSFVLCIAACFLGLVVTRN